MVNTSRFISLNVIWETPAYTIEAEYVDKEIFRLQAQHPGVTLNGILCEQGESFVLYFVLFFLQLSFLCIECHAAHARLH